MSIEITTASHILLSSIRLALEESYNSVPSTSSIQPFIGNNSASGLFSNVLGGQNNIASGDYSSVIGGHDNNSNNVSNVVILGTNITASLPDYTYVNNLSSQGNINISNGTFNTVGGNSNNWNNVYTSVNSTSASWNAAYTSTLSAGLSTANWNNTFSLIKTLSSDWQQTTTNVAVSSPGWNNISTLVHAKSALWGTGGDPFNATLIAATSGNWDNVYTSVNTLSDKWDSVYTNVNYFSGTWDFASATVIDYAGNWTQAYNNAVYSVSGTPGQIVASNSGTNNGDNNITLSFPQSAVFPGDLTVNGNFTVGGSATYVNTSNLIVNDSLIYLAASNIANELDIGLVGHFTQAPLGYNHTGFVRRAGQGNPGVWTLFSGLTTEPLTGINIDWNDKNIVIDSLSANLIGNVSDNLGGNNLNWNSVYTSVNNASANWNNVYTSVNATSGNWNSVYTLINTTTATTFNVKNLSATNTISTPTISTINIYGASSETVFTDGSNPSGNGTNTLTLNYLSGVYVNSNITVVGQIGSTDVVYASGGNSNNWNSAFNISTAYQNASGSFATNTLLQSTSALLTPLTTTRTLTATLLPTTVYQNASGSFATNTLLQSTSALLTPLTTTRTLTATLLPTTVYQNASGSFATNIVPVNIQTGTTYTIRLSDTGGTIGSTNAGTGLTATLVGAYPTGFQTSIIQLSTARVTLSGQNTTINNADGFFKTTKQYSAATLIYTGAVGGWVLFGNLSA